MSGPTIFGKAEAQFLADLGTALLHIKNERNLSLVQMGRELGRCDDMVSRYIAGEAEMGVVAWKRAMEAWPELAARIDETSEERAFRARQRPLDLSAAKQRSAA